MCVFVGGDLLWDAVFYMLVHKVQVPGPVVPFHFSFRKKNLKAFGAEIDTKHLHEAKKLERQEAARVDICGQR